MIVIDVYNLLITFLCTYVYLKFLFQGEYRTVFEKLYPCDSTRNYPLQFNNYFNKITSNTTELKGNITALIPFDDTLTVSTNLSILNDLIVIYYIETAILRNLVIIR